MLSKRFHRNTAKLLRIEHVIEYAITNTPGTLPVLTTAAVET